MTNQPGTSGNPGVPVAGAAAAASAWQDDEPQTDDGVPVGQADVQADRERASGDTGDDTDDADGPVLMDPPGDSTSTDDGVPVGSADAEEDRRRASDDDDA